jgi:hypothetical protein
MTNTTLIVAECRAEELLAALQAAVAGQPHWRLHATTLLRAIANHKLPEPQIEALREIDARKRAAEMMDDLCHE